LLAHRYFSFLLVLASSLLNNSVYASNTVRT
jgi:hypothetical protein